MFKVKKTYTHRTLLYISWINGPPIDVKKLIVLVRLSWNLSVVSWKAGGFGLML